MRIIVVALGESRLIIVFMRFSMVGRASAEVGKNGRCAGNSGAHPALKRASGPFALRHAKSRGKFHSPALDAARVFVVQSSV
jgi:hypothetical protein